MLEDVKAIFQDIVAPELRTLAAEIRRFDDRIGSLERRLDDKIDGTRSELLAHIRGIDDKIDSKHGELLAHIRRLDEKLEVAMAVRERLAALEAKFESLRC